MEIIPVSRAKLAIFDIECECIASEFSNLKQGFPFKHPSCCCQLHKV